MEMPHKAVKMFPGRTEERKREFAAKEILGSSNASLSISISEVDPTEWDARVYGSEIVANEKMLHKRPGYGALSQS